MQRHLQLNAAFWIAALGYAIGGASIFLSTLWTAPMFANLDDCFPIPIRVVMFVGPFGWLAMALLGAFVTLWVPSTRCRLTSVILFSLLSIAIMCTVMLTNIEHPSHIRASNLRATVDAAFALSLLSDAGGVAPVSPRVR